MVVWSTVFWVADSLNRLFFPVRLFIEVSTLLTLGKLVVDDENVVAAAGDADNDETRLEVLVEGAVCDEQSDDNNDVGTI